MAYTKPTPESRILYDNGQYWVSSAPYGYTVWQAGIIASTSVARIGYHGAEGLKRAIAEADRRKG